MKKRLYTLLIICIWVLIPGTVTAMIQSIKVNSKKDSLQQVLTMETSVEQRIKTLINLADISKGFEDHIQWCTTLYKESLKAENQQGLDVSLSYLILAGILNDDDASVATYMEKLNQIKDPGLRKSILYYYTMTQQTFWLFNKTKEQTENQKKVLELMRQYKPSGDKYEQIYMDYLTANAIANDNFNKRIENKYQQVKELLEKALVLTKELPLEHQPRFYSRIVSMLIQIDILLGEYPLAKQNALSALDMLDEVARLPAMKERPFCQDVEYNKNDIYGRLSQTAKVCTPEEMSNYYKIFYDYVKLHPELISARLSYEQSINHYVAIKDYATAILYTDSLIRLQDGMEVYLDVYRRKAVFYARLNQYQQAYETYKQYAVLKDSIYNQKSEVELSEIQVKYDTDQLKLKNAQLTLRTQRFFIAFSVILLLILAAWSIYRNKIYKKRQKLMESLQVANEKAQESEKVKRAFIDSMCHEIRTPLNAINGFTELIVDDDLDKELKQDFVTEITKNVSLLTSLLNDMIFLSQIGNTNENITDDQVDIYGLCHEQMDNMKGKQMNPDIQYVVDTPQGSCTIHCHYQYIAKLLANVLDNANKFTERGTISISCRIDRGQKQVCLDITDTGIGIPIDKQQIVFDKFVKLDSFKPGTGLGLYICKLLIRHLQGNICIDPHYTTGTKVIITLPLL